MPNKSLHIVRRTNGEWAVKKGGSTRASSIFKTQKEAISKGKAIARNQKSEFYIHDKDGKISDKKSYANVPFSSKR